MNNPIFFISKYEQMNEPQRLVLYKIGADNKICENINLLESLMKCIQSSKLRTKIREKIFEKITLYLIEAANKRKLFNYFIEYFLNQSFFIIKNMIIHTTKMYNDNIANLKSLIDNLEDEEYIEYFNLVINNQRREAIDLIAYSEEDFLRHILESEKLIEKYWKDIILPFELIPNDFEIEWEKINLKYVKHNMTGKSVKSYL